MTTVRARKSVTCTIALTIVALLATSLPAPALTADRGPAAAVPGHDTDAAGKPGKPDKDPACTQKDVRKDTARRVTADESWRLRLRTDDGKRLGLTRLRDGRCVPMIGIGLGYRVSARVPDDLRALFVGRTVGLEQSLVGSDAWQVVRHVPVDRNGRIRATFRATDRLANLRLFRVRLDAAMPVGPAGATALPMSETTTAAGVAVVVVQVVNRSGNDLNLQVPTAPTGSGDQWGSAEVAVNDGSTISLIYENVPTGTVAGFTMTKRKCFLDCTVYIIDWRCGDGANPCTWWKKRELEDASGNRYPRCAGLLPTDPEPQLVAGGTYVLTLGSSGAFNQGPSVDFIRGRLSGPLAGLDAPERTCIFGNSTRALEWIDDHPWKVMKLVAIATAALVAILLVSEVLAEYALERRIAKTTRAVTTGEYLSGFTGELPGPKEIPLSELFSWEP